MNAEVEMQEYQGKNDEFAKTEKMSRLLAHEIKNPLARIFLSVDQLKNPDEENPDSDFYIDMILRAGNEIDGIINNLILVTREIKIRGQKKNLIDITRSSLAIALEKTQPRSVSIVENYPRETIELELDEEKLTIALQNIIVNAIESIMEGNEGEIELEIAVRNNYAVVIVRDNGCGISDEMFGNLFVPFYSTKSQRSGLGLATARNIILAHQGKIEMKSGQGKGSEVVVSLPLSKTK